MAGTPYANVVDSLMYLMCVLGQDLAHAMSVVSRFIVNLGKEH